MANGMSGGFVVRDSSLGEPKRRWGRLDKHNRQFDLSLQLSFFSAGDAPAPQRIADFVGRLRGG
jgi:hypothetical protein